MEELKKAIELKHELDALRPIDGEREAVIMQKFRLDWNYHSNHLEGNTLTYGETKALLLFNITAQGKPLKDHIEVTGHNEAINWVLDLVKGDRPLSESFIRQIHELLLKEPYEVDAITPDGKPTKKKVHVGEYKKTPNHVKTVTGEIFRFATPEETPAKMTDLLNWYRSKTEEETVNPIFVAAEFHYKFIRIHPFDDGNGRTARIIMNFILMKYGFPPTIIKTEDKENYFTALRLADAGNIEAFINYIAENLVYSLELMISGAKGEIIEEEGDVEKEVALLEQRIEHLRKDESLENYNTNYDIINTSTRKLFAKISKKHNDLFKKFYKEVKKEVITGDVNGNKKRGISFDFLSEQELYNYCNLTLGFKVSSSEIIIKDYYFSISFHFNKESYEIQYERHYNRSSDEARINFKKYYNERLSDEEINSIIKISIIHHKNFLKDMIEQKENAKNK
jgi:Fic family protein